MNSIKKDAKVLIISWAPIPTPKYQKIEGSGQRFWGLATGLKKNGVKDITIAIGGIYPLDVDAIDGIKLFNYNFDDKFAKKIKEYDTVISNYAIHGANFIHDNLANDAQYILDAYGPAYIESLARDPEDMVGTYVGNLSAVREVFNKVIPRGDFLLYANDAQEKFYTGILASLGSINQFSYKTNKLLRVPFGIDKPDSSIKYENPYTELGVKDGDFTLLWFGGLYPWFDINQVLDTIKDLKDQNIKLVVVGGNNPQNQHPDFVKHYFNTVEYVKDNSIDSQVTFVEWADFATRRKYYEYADAIISMNNEGKENVYSWRTRVMDYVGSTTPLITNGGDPLSDELIEVGAAFKVDDNKPGNIKSVISKLVKNRQLILDASNKMKSIQPKYYWENVTKELAEKIKNQEKPYTDELDFKTTNGIGDEFNVLTNAPVNISKTVKIRNISKKVYKKIENEGLAKTAVVIGAKVRRKTHGKIKSYLKPVVNSDRKPKIFIFSNQLNNTGAPFVLIDLINQLCNKYPHLVKNIHVITFTPIELENMKKLRKMGVFVDVYTNRELPVDFIEGDIVFMNSFAVSRTTIGCIVRDVDAGKIKKVFWYGHEATPKMFIDSDIKNIFKGYLESGLAKVYVVSEQATRKYQEFFGIEKNIEKMQFRFNLDDKYFRVLEEDDFNQITFVNTGSLMDMRKGQYPILYAFLDFYHNKYQKNPDIYRDFKIKFIGAYDKSDETDSAAYHVKNIKKQFEYSASILGDKFEMTASMSHDEAMEEIYKSNITICYSMYEALPIFVYEGMATGHPIIRNDCPGKEEQLVDGVNGIAVYKDNYSSLVNSIEQILNKKVTSNSKLKSMSKESNRLAYEAKNINYKVREGIKESYEK